MGNVIKSLVAVSASMALSFSGSSAWAQAAQAAAAASAAQTNSADIPETTAGTYDSPEAIKERALRDLTNNPARVPGPKLAPSAETAKAMALAPAVITQQSLPCTLTSARYMFAAKAQHNGAQINSDFVEAACANAMGYVLIKHRGKNTSQFLDCIQAGMKGADGKDPQTKCRLPENARPELALAAHLGPRAASCGPAAAVALGETANGRLYEVKCEKGDGLLVAAPKPGDTLTAPIVATCFAKLGTADACTLTTAEQSKAAVVTLASLSGKACAPTNQRYMAGRAGGGGYYEFACSGGPGLVVLTKADGSFDVAASCAQASNIAGGCKLTSAQP